MAFDDIEAHCLNPGRLHSHGCRANESDSTECDPLLLRRDLFLCFAGVPGIKKCTMKQNKVQVYDPKTGEAKREEPWVCLWGGSLVLVH